MDFPANSCLHLSIFPQPLHFSLIVIGKSLSVGELETPNSLECFITAGVLLPSEFSYFEACSCIFHPRLDRKAVPIE